MNVAIVSINNGKHYLWDSNCDGWHLAISENLGVIQERVPEGSSEIRHLHNKAEQFFYVLSGMASLEAAGTLHVIQPNEGFYVPAGLAHTISNEHEAGPGFLLISTPPGYGDRENA
jgi:mannose-6-phosphate isomerase-like protein (cupin superfamily)